MNRTLEQLLAEARGAIERVTPNQAFSVMKEGAIMIDVRAQTAREQLGSSSCQTELALPGMGPLNPG